MGVFRNFLDRLRPRRPDSGLAGWRPFHRPTEGSIIDRLSEFLRRRKKPLPPPDFAELRSRCALHIGHLENLLRQLQGADPHPEILQQWEAFLDLLSENLPSKGLLLRLREWRFRADARVKWKAAGVPETMFDQLDKFKGRRFRQDEAFLKELGELVGVDEARWHLQAILSAAETAPQTSENDNVDLLEGYENIFRQADRQLQALVTKGRQEDGLKVLHELRKRFLKLWQPFAREFPAELQDELARLILRNGDDDPRWILYCVPQLDRLRDEVSVSYNQYLRQLVKVNLEDLDGEAGQEADRGKLALKHVVNTQLTLLDNEYYRWAHVNIARLVMTKDFLEKVFREEVPIDTYIDWHISRAAQAGALVSDSDRLLGAYSQFLKKNYSAVIELLGELTDPDEPLLQYRKQQLLALAHGELWLRGDARADAGTALRILTNLKRENRLSANELFLYLRLLEAHGNRVEAREIFEQVDLNAVKTDLATIVDVAWSVGAHGKAESYLEQQLQQASTEDLVLDLLHRLCASYRCYSNQFGKAADVIAQIRKMCPDHPWVEVADSSIDLDNDRTDAAEARLTRLPAGEIWEAESQILQGRIALKRHAADAALDIFREARYTDRIDYQYWRAVIRAHQGALVEAYSAVEAIAGDAHFKAGIDLLRGQLLLAQARYEEALELFNKLEADERIRVYKAWAFFYLRQYAEARECIADVKTSEALFLTARIADETHDAQNARAGYRRVIERMIADPDAELQYLADALARFTSLVIAAEARPEADWLLSEPRLAERIPGDQLAHIFIMKKDWNQALQALQAQNNNAASHESLLYIYQQLLFHYIENHQWKKAQEMVDRLEGLGDQVEAYSSFIERARLLSRLGKPGGKIDFETFEAIEDDMVQVALALYKFLENKLSFEAIYERISIWASRAGDMPEPALLMLILALLKNDPAQAADYARSVLERETKFANEGLQMIARTLASMVLDARRIAMEDLLNIVANYRDKLPISLESFWQKVLLTVARQDIERARELLDKTGADIKVEPASRAAVYANSAYKHLEAGRHLPALEDLRKATGE